MFVLCWFFWGYRCSYLVLESKPSWRQWRFIEKARMSHETVVIWSIYEQSRICIVHNVHMIHIVMVNFNIEYFRIEYGRWWLLKTCSICYNMLMYHQSDMTIQCRIAWYISNTCCSSSNHILGCYFCASRPKKFTVEGRLHIQQNKQHNNIKKQRYPLSSNPYYKKHYYTFLAFFVEFFHPSSYQLFVNRWFAARWFGIRIGIALRIPIPFIFGDPIGIQTTRPQTTN